MSTLFSKPELTFFQRLMIRFLRKCTLPTHIGFIMDGNRRYARKMQVDRRIGYAKGIERLVATILLCRELAINQLTLYAFSIENFKRSSGEVDVLIELMHEQFRQLEETLQVLDEQKICVQIYGQINLFPQEFQKTLARVSLHTAKNQGGLYLNFALAYSSREEIVTAMSDLSNAVNQGIIQVEDINQNTFSRALYSLDMPDPELILRTSGEIRLSDFFLWQAGFSYVFFAGELWPNLSPLTLLRILLQFQVETRLLQERRQYHEAQLENEGDEYFLANNFSKKLIEQRNERLENCLQYIRKKRLDALRHFVKDK